MFDFFGRQQQARLVTRYLLIYLVLVMVLIAVAVNIFFYFVAILTGYDDGQGSWLWHVWSAKAYGATVSLIASGSMVEWFLLREGGVALANMIQANKIDFASKDSQQQQLVNVCEEMAIAAGMTMPSLYVLHQEKMINAFVAGYKLQDSILVLTQGALDYLNRDELQAVIGHEYSHIINGDMRLNTYLVSILAGIVNVGQAGDYLIRLSYLGSQKQIKPKKAWPIPIIYVVGLIIWLIGYIGLFFARLVKAAISRSRENLADAASVQFTRYPDALASALYKISQHGSLLQNRYAEQLSHMCFADSVLFAPYLASHPPIKQRINIISPSFLTRMKYRQDPITAEEPQPKTSASIPVSIQADGLIAFSAVELPIIAATMTASKVGDLQWQDLMSAQYLHRQLAVEVSRALQGTQGAKAVIFALVANQQHTPTRFISDFFNQQPAFAQTIIQLQQHLKTVDTRLALPVVELAIPRLQHLTEQELQTFIRELKRFVGQIDNVFEFALLSLIEQQLSKSKAILRQLPLTRLAQPCAELIATLLHYGAHPIHLQKQIYQQLMPTMFAEHTPVMPVIEKDNFTVLAKALQQLQYLTPKAKQQLITLAAATIQSDGILHRAEYELLRVLASLLACPMPLLLGQIHVDRNPQ
ncbi:MAG: M48 family metalloprotease [Agitococcus sp.]